MLTKNRVCYNRAEPLVVQQHEIAAMQFIASSAEFLVRAKPQFGERTQLTCQHLNGRFRSVVALNANFVGDSSCGDTPQLHALVLLFCNFVAPKTLDTEEIFLAIVTLETERLRLRAFRPNDLEIYTERIFGDPAVMKYLPARSDALPIERAQRTMDFFNAEWATTSYGPWAVERKQEGELIGHCGLRLVSEINETEVLYAFGQEYWGEGYATEAARASVAFGFDQCGLDRIIALAVPENIGSRKVMEHCGLKYEKEIELFGLHCVYYALNRADFDSMQDFS